MCRVSPHPSDFACLNVVTTTAASQGEEPVVNATTVPDVPAVYDVGGFQLPVADVQAIIVPTQSGNRERAMNHAYTLVKRNAGAVWKYKLVMATLSALQAALEVASALAMAYTSIAQYNILLTPPARAGAHRTSNTVKCNDQHSIRTGITNHVTNGAASNGPRCTTQLGGRACSHERYERADGNSSTSCKHTSTYQDCHACSS